MFKTVPITVQSTDKDKGQTDKTQAEDSGNRTGSTDPILSTDTNRAEDSGNRRGSTDLILSTGTTQASQLTQS